MNTFTFENTKEATHLRWSKCHKMFCFYLSDGFNIWQGGNGFIGHYHKDCDNESIELSRPIGERKEDHTDENGVVTYALQPSHHIELAIGADAINDVVISPDEPVIEQWVGDQITEQKESPCPGKPVFTQDMAKHRQAAPIGSSVQTSMGEGVVVAHGVSYGRSQVVIQTNETMLSLDDSQYCPIDNRSDKEKLHDGLYGFVSGYVACGQQEDIDDYVRELLSKFTITLKE